MLCEAIRPGSSATDAFVELDACSFEQTSALKSPADDPVPSGYSDLELFAAIFVVVGVMSALLVMSTEIRPFLILAVSAVLVGTIGATKALVAPPKSSSCPQGFNSASEASILLIDGTERLTGRTARLDGIEVFSAMTEREVLAMASSLEANVQHPLAIAIRGSAAFRGVGQMEAVDVEVLPGLGIRGCVNGHSVFIGSRLAVEEGCGLHPSDGPGAGTARAYMVVDCILVACLSFRERPMDLALRSLAVLKREGVMVVFLTARERQAASEIMRAIPLIDAVVPNLLPDDKARMIAGLRARGTKVRVLD